MAQQVWRSTHLVQRLALRGAPLFLLLEPDDDVPRLEKVLQGAQQAVGERQAQHDGWREPAKLAGIDQVVASVGMRRGGTGFTGPATQPGASTNLVNLAVGQAHALRAEGGAHLAHPGEALCQLPRLL